MRSDETLGVWDEMVCKDNLQRQPSKTHVFVLHRSVKLALAVSPALAAASLSLVGLAPSFNTNMHSYSVLYSVDGRPYSNGLGNRLFLNVPYVLHQTIVRYRSCC